ncbi:YMGG-like glycine zipper-containing protein [Brevundimonas sp.]|jgi:hypothetical protein|uniref:YMGG-like glycine zipper-containing protein n=1 Tax=Brevundimonas sp. TaxID=1871086 RepID=UPI002EDB0777
MRHLWTMTAAAACGLTLSGCASMDNYASACERDYERNRQRAMAAGALLGGAIGAAVAGSEDREKGAAIGAAAGVLLGHALSDEDDPCGYGFGGYNTDYRYGRERIYWRDDDRRW